MPSLAVSYFKLPEHKGLLLDVHKPMGFVNNPLAWKWACRRKKNSVSLTQIR
jgi:hypothetical protein